jgi:DNA-binding transcriptional LysR family regulator
MSSPPISTAISQLEETFGLQLFIRQHAQGLVPTAAGREFLAEARALLDQAGALHDVADRISGETRGAIAIGGLVTVAPLILPGIRRSFELACPGAEVRQHTGHQAGLIDRLRDASLDIALTYDLEIPTDIEFEPLAALPPLVLLADDHPLGRAQSVDLRQLAQEPLILLDLPASRDYFLSLFRQAGVEPRLAERIDDITVIRTMVANGFGYSLANARPRTDLALDGSRLRTVPLAGDHPPLMIGMATARTRRKPRILEAFEDHCRQMISEGGIPGLADGLPVSG